MKKNKKINFEQFELPILNLVITDTEYGKTTCEQITPNDFNNNYYKLIFRCVVEYYNDHKYTPSFDVLLDLLSKDKMTRKEIDIYTNTIEEIENLDVKDKGYIKNMTNDYFKFNNYDKILGEYANALDDGDIGSIETLIPRLHQISNSTSGDIIKLPTTNECIANGLKLSKNKSVIGDIVTEGETHILFSNNGNGKSALSMQIGDRLSRGLNVYDFLSNDVGQMKTMMFDFELNDSQRADRYTNDNDEPYIFSTNLFTVSLENLKLNRNVSYIDAMLTELRRYILAFDGDLVILDNLSAIINEGAEKSDVGGKVIMKLKDIKTDYKEKNGKDLTIIVIAHTPKIKDYTPISINHLAGTKQLSNLVDGVSAIGSSVKSDQIKYWIQIKPSRSRPMKYGNKNVISMELVKRDKFLGFEFLGFGSEEEQLDTNFDIVKHSRDEQIIKQYLSGCTYDEISKEVDCSKGLISKVIKKYKAKLAAEELVNRKKIEKTKGEKKSTKEILNKKR